MSGLTFKYKDSEVSYGSNKDLLTKESDIAQTVTRIRMSGAQNISIVPCRAFKFYNA